MARILALDYGGRRTGIAVTDSMKMIATSLDGIKTSELIPYLTKYFSKEKVETIVIGKPMFMDGNSQPLELEIQKLILVLNEKFPEIPIERIDERFTSKLASRSMIEMGMKKKDRRIKSNLDSISAVLILQNFLDSKK